MKTHKSLLVIMAASICLISCKKSKYIELEKVKWVLGSWENVTSQGTLTEIWERENDSTFSGISYFLKGTDTLFTEKISLQQRDDQLLYVPTITNQNAGKPVAFAMIAISDKQFVFENPKHDFPQKITYNLIKKDSIVAEISGTENGMAKNETFPLKKMQK